MTADAKSARAAPKAGLVHETIEIVKTIVYALLIALVLKVIVFQPYTIPSASEEPNLYEGDYIIVSKWSYGWSRHSIPFSPPIFSGRILFNQPQRGDIVVFKLPRDGNTDYIKRLVGLPGDTIQVKGGQVYINGKALPRVPMADATGDLPDGNDLPVLRFDEQMPNGRQHVIQKAPTGSQADNTGVYVVPPHCYFMLGDNRDNSLDSRFDPGLSPDDPKLGGCGWNSGLDEKVGDQAGVGFVPEENLVGQARLILLSWDTGVDEQHPGGASIFKPWTWFTDARPNRFFKVLH
jgi:signal peptidase I